MDFYVWSSKNKNKLFVRVKQLKTDQKIKNEKKMYQFFDELLINFLSKVKGVVEMKSPQK